MSKRCKELSRRDFLVCGTASIGAIAAVPALAQYTGNDLVNLDRSGKDNGAATQILARIQAGKAFSFLYDGKSSQDQLLRWKRTETAKSLRGGRELHVTTYLDPATGLEVSSEITTFSEAPAVECILRLRNTGKQDTPIIENILPLDLTFTVPGAGKVVMHSANGSVQDLQKVVDFLPIDQEVVSGTEIDMAHFIMNTTEPVDSQRPLPYFNQDSRAPFFNLEWQEGGLIVAVGWSGQWAVHLSGEGGRGVALQSGQQKTHLRLHPGESIRTPRILLLQWQGSDRMVGHNQLRRLLLAHYIFRRDGQIVIPPVSDAYFYTPVFDEYARKTGRNPLTVMSQAKVDQEKEILSQAGDPADGLNGVNEQNQLDLIRHMDSAGIEAYWLDAGWFEGGWAGGAGSWIPDAKKFPNGLKPVSDAAHEKGLKFILWFEPGRATHISRIATEHPEWVLHATGESDEWGGLFNYGDPAALRWMTEDLSAKIDAWGVDIFRNDSNICPVAFWRTADAPDRQGITENHWVEGLYGFWDGLLRTHPELAIDNGNWRITGPDIEAMSRTIGALTRSESDISGFPHSAAAQYQTMELSLWVPVNAGILNGFDPYIFRSEATMGGVIGLDLSAPYVALDQVKTAIAELKSLRPFWLGDYYPLTEVNLDEHAWAGWQFYRPDLGAGFAVLFRRSLSPKTTFEASLRGLDSSASYEVTFAKTYEVTEKRTMTGEELWHLHVEIESAPGSMLIRYKKTGVKP